MVHSTHQEKLASFFKSAVILPVITLENIDHAIPLAEALVKGGIKHLEITMRSSVALKGAELIIKNVPEAVVGIGTVLTPDDLKRCVDIGAQFALSPGATPKLLDAAADSSLPFCPGIATASELMAAMERGFHITKFFPAATSGGIEALKALSGPFPKVSFCPTGGLNIKNFREWLDLPNVIVVGGSWLTPKADILSGNWAAITAGAVGSLNLAKKVL